MKPTPASEIPVEPTPATHPHLFPHFRDGHSDDSIPVVFHNQPEIPVEISEEFEIPGLIQFDFLVETRLENPVDFEVNFRSD